jgi:hypothetical protein
VRWGTSSAATLHVGSDFSKYIAVGTLLPRRGHVASFNAFLAAMKAARENPVLLGALSKHAERKLYEIAAYVGCWEPNSQYGQVRGLAAPEPLLFHRY